MVMWKYGIGKPYKGSRCHESGAEMEAGKTEIAMRYALNVT